MMCGSRWKIALTLTGIFLAGGVAGGFAGYAWSRNDPRPRISPDQYTERYLQRMITDVKLTSEQVECLRPMMEEFSEKLSVMRQKAFAEARAVLRDMDRRIESDLTPEQRELYRQMQEHDRAMRERKNQPQPQSTDATKAKVEANAGLDDGAASLPPPPSSPHGSTDGH